MAHPSGMSVTAQGCGHRNGILLPHGDGKPHQRPEHDRGENQPETLLRHDQMVNVAGLAEVAVGGTSLRNPVADLRHAPESDKHKDQRREPCDICDCQPGPVQWWRERELDSMCARRDADRSKHGVGPEDLGLSPVDGGLPAGRVVDLAQHQQCRRGGPGFQDDPVSAVLRHTHARLRRRRRDVHGRRSLNDRRRARIERCEFRRLNTSRSVVAVIALPTSVARGSASGSRR